MDSFEIQKDVDGTLVRMRLEKVPHGLVMHGQFAENLFTMRQQFDEEFLKFCLVEEIARSDGPSGIKLAFGREGESCEDDLAEIVWNTFQYAHYIGDGVGLIVIACDRIELGREISVMPVLLPNAIPAFLQLHAISHVSRF